MVDESDGDGRSDWYKIGAIGAIAAWYSGVSIPEWSILAASGLVVAAIGAAFATGKIEDLIPEPEKRHLVRINATGDAIAYWELSPDAWADVSVEWGPLYPHDAAGKKVYECYAFDPDSMVAVGTWRRSLPGSEVVGRHGADEVLDVLDEYRTSLEPESRRGRELRQALPRILRQLDYQRMKAQNAAVDPALGPETGGPSIDDTIVDNLPDELRPGRLQNGDLRTLLDADGDDADGDDWVGDGFDLLEGDGEALEPNGPLMNDGGSHES
jgi:hypothetical protein